MNIIRNYSSIPFVTDDSFEWSIFPHTIKPPDKKARSKNLQVDLCGSDLVPAAFTCAVLPCRRCTAARERTGSEERTAMKTVWAVMLQRWTPYWRNRFCRTLVRTGTGQAEYSHESIVINSEKDLWVRMVQTLPMPTRNAATRHFCRRQFVHAQAARAYRKNCRGARDSDPYDNLPATIK